MGQDDGHQIGKGENFSAAVDIDQEEVFPRMAGPTHG